MSVDPWGWYAYQDNGVDHLTNYLRNDPQPSNMVKAILSPFRDLEYLHHQLFDMLSITRATGQGLDAFGELVKIYRLGRNDDDYRQAILAKRFSSGGSGTPVEIKRALHNIAVGVKARLVGHYPAAFIAQLRGYSPAVDETLTAALRNMAAAGVHAYATHDYGKGGFALAGVAGVLYNVIGVGPTASGNDDQAMGVNGTAPIAPATGEIIAPAAGTQPLTLNDANGISYVTDPQTAVLTLYKGQTWTGTVKRGAGTLGTTTVKTGPATATATAAITTAGALTVVAKAAGATRFVVASSAGDTLFVSVVVVDTTVLGVNASYATIGGTPLAGEIEFRNTGAQDYGSVQRGALCFGTFKESV